MAQATRSAAHSATNATTINITNTGFDPAVVTVDTGEAVVWINQTTRVQQVVGGAPYRVFLPLVVRAFKGNVAAQAAVDTQSATQSPSWGSGAIQPGGRYTHTFTTTGDYPYLLSGSPDITGLVQVSEPQQPPDFDLGIAPASQRVIQGQSVGYTLTLTGTHGFNTPVTLGVTGLPTGANASWQTNPLVPNGSSVLTITTLSNTPVGSYTVTINASGGGQSHTAQVTLQVDPAPSFTLSVDPGIRTVAQGKNVGYTVAVTALHGFSEAVSLAVADLPAGATVAWSHNPLVPSNTAVMTITTALNTPTGDHSLNVRATGGDIVQQVAVILTVTPHPDFVLSIEPEAQTTVQNESVAYTVHLTSEHNFTAPVSLSLEGLPTGSTATWSANPVAPSGTTVLTITTTSQTPIGDHVLELTGVGDGLTHSASALLSVSLHPGFTLAITPAEQSVFQGQLAVYATTITGLYDFTEPVQLTLSGLPAGVTAAIAPNPVTPSGTAAITLTTALTAPLGTHALTLTGTSGGRSHNILFTLVVTPHPDFTIGIQPPTRTVTQAHSVTYTVALAPEHGFAAPVTLSVSGLPSGATANWSANPNVPPANVTLTITAGSQTPTGNYTLLVTGTGGGFVHTTSAGLSVTLHDGFALAIDPDIRSVPQGTPARYTATVTGLYDFTEPVQLTLSGLPAGIAATIVPNPVTPSGTAAITLTTALTTPLGTHALTLTGTGGGRSHNIPFTLVVTPHPDFTIGIQPPTRTVTQAHSVTYTVALAPEHSFAAPVTLSVSGLPSGATANWSANPNVPPANVTLTITAGSQTPTGDYTLLVTGTGGGFVHTTSAELSVTLHDGFTLAIDPDTRSVPQGQRAVYTATVTGLYDFTEPVQLTLSGLPAGVTAVIAPNPVAPSGTAAITLTTALTAPLGTHALTLAGTGGGRSHTSPLTLTITPHPDFAMVAEPITGTVRQSRIATTLINITALHGFAAPVTLTVSGLPNGVAPDWSTNPIVPDGSSVLTLTTALTAPLGLYPLAITGSGGGFVHTAPFTLTVLEHPDFVFSIAPPTQTITRGLSVTFTAQLDKVNDWNTPVALEVEGLPHDAAASWSVNPVVPNGNSMLTITPALSTPSGVYSLWAVADGGLISHTLPITLHVQASSPPDLVILNLNTDPLTPTLNVPFTLTAAITNLGGATSKAFEVAWYADPATNLLTTTTSTGSWQMSGLSAGNTQVLTTTGMFSTTGVHTLMAYADPTGVLSESDVSNNAIGPITVTVKPPQIEMICGNISGIWAADKIHVVTCESNVPTGSILTLKPGAIVKFDGTSSGINVYGVLNALGTPTQPIVLTSFKDDTHGDDTNGDGDISVPAPGDWSHIYIAPGATTILDYVLMQYGGYGTTATLKALISNRGALAIRNSQLNYSLGYGIHSNKATLTTTSSIISQNGDSGINVYASGTTIILNNIVEGNGGAGISLNASGNITPTIVGNIANDNSTYPLMLRAGTYRIMLTEEHFHDNQGTGNGVQGVWITGAFAGTLIPQSDLVYVTDNIGDIRSGGSTNYRGSLTVKPDDELVLRPGIIIKFTPPGYGTFLIYGVLQTQGTATNPVVFTSLSDDVYGGDTNGDGDATSGQPGDWSGIRLMEGSEGILDHFIGHYGGNYYYYYYPSTAVVVERGGTNIVSASSADLTLTHSQIAYSALNGIGASGTVLISHSNFHENGATGLSATSSINGAVLITATEAISNGGNGIGVDASGTGQVANCLTRSNSSNGIRISASGIITVLNNIVEGNGGAGISLNASGNITPTIVGNIANDNGTYPLMLRADTYRIMLTEEHFHDNQGTGNGVQGVWITGAFAGTLIPQSDLVYVTDNIGDIRSGGSTNYRGSLTVKPDDELVLRPGIIIKFTPPGYGTFLIYGVLQTQGTATNPVVFTSLSDDVYGGDTNGDGDATSGQPGDWSGIRLMEGSEGILDHFIGHYGGNYYYYYYPSTAVVVERGGTNIVSASSADLTLTHSQIAYSALNGIAGNSSAFIHDNMIFENEIYGVTGNDVDARNNWWGSSSGPAPYGSGNGVSYTTSCSDSICTIVSDVQVIPWIGQQTYYGPSVPNVIYEADPVNTANGNYSYQYTDLSIDTRGLPLAFLRTYNALAPENGPLGWGWHHNWLMTVKETGDLVFVTYGNGHQARFTWNGSAYEPAPGLFATLIEVGDHFELTEKDQTTYVFNAEGQLASVADRNGNTTTLGYDGQNRLETVTEPAGRTLSLSYTSPLSSAFLTQVLDPAGRTIQYTYNVTGDLTLVTDTTGHTTTYQYDDQHRMLSITDANSHTFVTNEYNSSGRVVKQWDGLGNLTTFAYDEPTHKTVVTDPLERETTYQYDDLLRLTSETDALNHSAFYVYDDDNNRTQVTDKRGFITLLDYDEWGNTTLITDALEGRQTFVYNDYNQPTRVTDPLSHTTVYTYNTVGDLVASQDALGSVVRWAYNPYGQVISVTDALTRTTYYGYDIYGYRSSITDALGSTTTFIFDTVGRQLTEIDAAGQVVTHTYDDANRLLSIAEPLGRLTQYTYDKVGNLLSTIDPRGGVTTFSYDRLDRLVSTTDPLSHTTSFGYDAVGNQITVTDALSHTTIYTYDALDRKIGTTDPLTHTTVYAYDANGNLTSITDANSNVTSYTYDALGRLLTVTDAEDGVVTYSYDAIGNRTVMTDANTHVTIYVYDALSRLISTTNPLSYTIVYTYDVVGNRVARHKPDGTVLQYTFDPLDRLAAINAPDLAIAYSYDEIGNRTAMTDSTGVTTYDYDALYRLKQVTAPTGTLQYGYDLNGNRTQLIYPDGKVASSTYDLANRLTTVTDWEDRSTTYTYDDADRQIAVRYPNNTQAAYSYDDAGGLLGLRHTSLVSGTIGVFTYTLDAGGNRLTMEDLEGATSYAYDDLYRLTEVTYPDTETVAYSYDPMGNRTAMTSTVTGVVTYTYDAADRLLSYTDAVDTTTLTWDDNGNMIGKGSAIYTFDALDRLTQVISGTTDMQFTYNGDGVRVSKSVNGQATDYVQDVGIPLPMVVAETTGSGTDAYIYGNDLVGAENAVGEVVYYHQDGLGSTRGLSNEAGELTDAYTYNVFGALRGHTGSSSQDFTFTGEQVENELGLVFLRARYYDPEIGRFVSRDGFPAHANVSQTLNRYVYTRNNPVRLTDPTGYFSIDLNAETNGINDWFRDKWNNSKGGQYLKKNTPVLSPLVDTMEGMQQYSTNRARQLDLINANLADEDNARAYEEAERAAMQGLERGLSSAAETAMSTPGTSFRPDCGLTDFVPKPFGDIFSFRKNPSEWALKKSFDATLLDPIREIPSHAVHYQFRSVNSSPGGYLYWHSYTAGGGWGGGGSASWGGPPSAGK